MFPFKSKTLIMVHANSPSVGQLKVFLSYNNFVNAKRLELSGEVSVPGKKVKIMALIDSGADEEEKKFILVK